MYLPSRVSPALEIVFVDVDGTLVRSAGSKRIPIAAVVDRVRAPRPLLQPRQQLRLLGLKFLLGQEAFVAQAAEAFERCEDIALIG